MAGRNDDRHSSVTIVAKPVDENNLSQRPAHAWVFEFVDSDVARIGRHLDLPSRLFAGEILRCLSADRRKHLSKNDSEAHSFASLGGLADIVCRVALKPTGRAANRSTEAGMAARFVEAHVPHVSRTNGASRTLARTSLAVNSQISADSQFQRCLLTSLCAIIACSATEYQEFLWLLAFLTAKIASRRAGNPRAINRENGLRDLPR